VTGKTLSKNQRIVKASLFREAFAQKQSFAGRFMVLWLRRDEDAALRLGVVSSKKVSRRAVDRNRARRILRAVYREHRAGFSGNADVVMIARRNLLSAAYSEIDEEFLRLAAKAGLLKSKPHSTGQEMPNDEGD
jgi:ribonuclease P protein component